VSLHSEISELRRRIGDLASARTSGDFESILDDGNSDAVGVPELRQALLATFDSLALLNIITDRLVRALSDIEIRLYQLNNAGPGAAGPR
jgi:hypothetical protein